MINQILNNNLVAMRNLFNNTGNDSYVTILDQLIDKEISKDYLQELSSHFDFGMTFSTQHVLFKNKINNKIIDIDNLVNNVNTQICLEKTKIEESQEFLLDEDNNMYNIVLYGIKFISPNNNEEIKRYAINLAKKYQKKGEYLKCEIRHAVASYLLKDDYFIDIYGSVNRNELIKKLNLPTIKLLSDKDGVLEYVNHELDNEHIISIEFDALFSKFTDICIDG